MLASFQVLHARARTQTLSKNKFFRPHYSGLEKMVDGGVGKADGPFLSFLFVFMEVFGLNLSHTFSWRLDFASEIPFRLSPLGAFHARS